MIGQQDRTTLGRGDLPSEVLKMMVQYLRLGKRTTAALQYAMLVELEDLGHISHLEAKRRFNAELLKFFAPIH
ncbi:MAG TPA: hypothetical protein VKB96_07945 [Gammaproteobacteria bacterium]|nr:hypothetical protein [Gammaproteobacteria bacterium]